jgi:hypothetical protein
VPAGCHAPLFLQDGRGRPPGRCHPAGRVALESPEVADCRELNLEPGRVLRSRTAGLFLFLPLLTRIGFDGLVAQAGYPGSEMIPAPSALISLLVLKLLDKERRSHIDDFNTDEALGLFAGLNILPKKSFATAYSYRAGRAQQLGLMQGWVKALAPLMFPAAEGFSLDFHPIPYRGDPAGLDRHYLPRRGKAGTSVLTFFALEQKGRCLCYANANLTRADQKGETMRFVECWHTVTGSDPRWLYFDSKVVDYPELSRINGRGIHFVTIRRRGVALLRRLGRQPASAWKTAVIDIPKRCHQRIRYLAEPVRLRGADPPSRCHRVGPRRLHAVPLQSLRGNAAGSDHPLRGAQPDRRWSGDQRELLPPGLPGQRSATERRPRRGTDGDRQRLLPPAGVAAPWLRDGGAEATLPPVHRDGRDGGG